MVSILEKEFLVHTLGYYFLAVFCFSLLSGILAAVYIALLRKYVRTKYPSKHFALFSNGLGVPTPTKWKVYRRLKDLGDDKLDNLTKKVSFWICSYLCAFIAFLISFGVIVFLALAYGKK